jgi:gliding motility-associated protein GldL
MAGTNKTIDRLVNIVVCVGAAVVIFGAWQKILHKPLADMFLTIGLLTEAVIFLIYALLPPPGGELAGLAEALPKMSANTSNPALNNLDKMMQDADISPANLQKLGSSFKSLGSTIDGIKDVSNVVAATSDYTNKTKEAADALGQMKTAYQNAAGTMTSFNNAAESTKNFHEQVQVLTKNLNSLNTIYELELKDANSHLKALNNFYGSLAQASKAMEGSVDDANKAKEQMGALAGNLTNLNKVYGAMLTAMSGR